MLSSTEFKILPDEIAKIIADNKKKDKIISKQASIISEYKALLFEQQSLISTHTPIIHEQASVISKLEKRLAYYENHNSPPSQNSILSQERKKRVSAKSNTDATPKKSGRKSGHKGQSHNKKSSKTIKKRPDKCGTCGSKKIKDSKIISKQITDVEYIPECKTTTYVMHECICMDCNAITKPESIGLEGTSLGPNILCILTNLWNNGLSLESIRDMLNIHNAGMCVKQPYTMRLLQYLHVWNLLQMKYPDH